MVAVPLRSAVQLYLASLNVAELYSSVGNVEELGAAILLVTMEFITTTSLWGITFISFVLNTDRSSPNPSNKVGFITIEKAGAVAPREVGTG